MTVNQDLDQTRVGLPMLVGPIYIWCILILVLTTSGPHYLLNYWKCKMLQYFNYYYDNKRLCLHELPLPFLFFFIRKQVCVPPCRRWHGTIPCLQHYLGPGDPPSHMTRPTCFLWVDNIRSFLKIPSKFPFTYHRVLYAILSLIYSSYTRRFFM